ncbi:peptide-N(4)-(N-acetyl-beta-glucosaminyl)asparagine amidase [Asparagus officinalis]|uniref:peptide-N(4)-(N-acetyl-beta- glucosaminyl)asparagine amidase n=1 Tax=Asparagus officinalis TaxID=4686 RepID=UPI00098E60FE|nr:peptide-N(4)-(N-acetyl-beta-glucosaminyl)asparagine amidase [Asparagus officinalis]
MVARQFIVHHKDSEFPIDYDTDDGFEVLKFQIFSLTSIDPEEQKILVEDQNLIMTESSDLESISSKLRLVSINEEQAEEKKEKSLNQFVKSDEELARILQAEEDALFFQQYRASENSGEFEGRVRPYVKQVFLYEDPVRQEAARKSVPVDEVEEKALVSLAKEGKFKPSKEEKDHAFLLHLLSWFKQSFRWVNSPPCENCGSGTSNIGMGTPLPSEISYGGSRVELYRCNCCSSITRFPRYNDPLKLLETRKGRCGEWANCFTLYCRAFGYESRLILDFTDHVWTESFSHCLGRWMHLDPCEGVYDNPLLYEKGWNKKLNYVIAIAQDGVYDVTKRYTRKWHEVLSRRNITTETNVSAVLSFITKECRARYSSRELSILEHRDQKEIEELEGELYHKIDNSVSLPGRQSGAIEWRLARSEMGSNGSTSLGISSCPIRLCVDSHVKNIYTALYLLLLQFLDNGYEKNEIVKILATLKKLLVDLRASPFKERRSFINFTLSQSSDTLMTCIEGFLASISLKGELENDGRMCVCLAGDPVQTSLALPVAMDAVDEIANNLTSDAYFEKDAIEFPRANRLSSGSVLASGEELPVEIATSAFDGMRLSKWGEPNGAKGCWLLYKVLNDQMHELEAYQLMSANDAPERDPVDWIVEGSDDGGINWYLLDKQSSQLFEKRFQRKTFKVDTSRKSNAFRFHFLSVRDPKMQSRFQIGSIDLYTKEG